MQNIKIRKYCLMYVRKLGRWYNRVHWSWHIRHFEFEPSGSAIAPNPTCFKMASWSIAKEFPTPQNGLNILWICFDEITKSEWRSSSMLRPLKLGVEPTFYWFSFVNERKHKADRSILVLYPASCVLYLQIGSPKNKHFQETHSCLLWKSKIWNSPMPSEFQS